MGVAKWKRIHWRELGGSSADTPHGHFGGLILDDLCEWGAPQQQSFCATSTNWSNWNSVRTMGHLGCPFSVSWISYCIVACHRGEISSESHLDSHLNCEQSWTVSSEAFSLKWMKPLKGHFCDFFQTSAAACHLCMSDFMIHSVQHFKPLNQYFIKGCMACHGCH